MKLKISEKSLKMKLEEYNKQNNVIDNIISRLDIEK